MALNCNRRAFEMIDGCPPVEVDLTFPDFKSCEDADPSRLKEAANLGMQQSPAFPMFIPANDPVPAVVIPDVDVDIDCGFDDTETSVSIDTHGSTATGSLEFDTRSDSCAVERVSLNLDFPAMAFLGTLSNLGTSNVANPFEVPDDMLTLFVAIPSDSYAAVF